MNNFQKRFFLFIFGCIGFRLFLVYLAKTQLNWLPYLGYLALIPAIGFLIIYIFGLRKTGAEVMGEKIWWNPLRPVHALFWFVFAFLAIRKDSRAWIVLLIDTLIGLSGFTIYHYKEGDFKNLFS